MRSTASWKAPAALAIALMLGGCALPAAPPAVFPAALLDDARFPAPAPQDAVDDPFSTSDAMRRFVESQVIPEVHRLGPARALVQSLQRREGIWLDYDAQRTRNAAEAFEARRGNCLSLALMTASMARLLGLSVTYQLADGDPVWSRNSDLALRALHVNLRIGKHLIDRNRGYNADPDLTVDFVPGTDVAGLRTREIAEHTLVAMYMNNRAAEALAAGATQDAYWWARSAVLHDGALASAVNTLAVVYLRHGDADDAERVFELLLRRDPDNTLALANLSILLDSLGRHEESAVLRARLARVEPRPPFQYEAYGIAALRRGDAAAARGYFLRELEAAGSCAECHYWLAIADLRLGRVAEAADELAAAQRTSVSAAEQQLYGAKLERLRALARGG